MTDSFFLCVTGGRSEIIAPHFEAVLRSYLEHTIVLLHGGCPHPADAGRRSIDAWSGEVAARMMPTVPTLVKCADWKRHGRSAGPIRNRELAAWCRKQVYPAKLLAFPGGAGTANCRAEFIAVHLEVIDVPAAPVDSRATPAAHRR